MVLRRRIIVLLIVCWLKGRGEPAAFDKKENDLLFTMVIGKTSCAKTPAVNKILDALLIVGHHITDDQSSRVVS